MNWLTIIVGVIRLIDYAMTRIQMSDGAKIEIAMELAKVQDRIAKTREIVNEKVSDEQVDADLRR